MGKTELKKYKIQGNEISLLILSICLFQEIVPRQVIDIPMHAYDTANYCMAFKATNAGN